MLELPARHVRHDCHLLDAHVMLLVVCQVSVSLTRKFLFWLDFAMSKQLLKRGQLLFVLYNPKLNHKGMECHASQYVWCAVKLPRCKGPRPPPCM